MRFKKKSFRTKLTPEDEENNRIIERDFLSYWEHHGYSREDIRESGRNVFYLRTYLFRLYEEGFNEDVSFCIDYFADSNSYQGSIALNRINKDTEEKLEVYKTFTGSLEEIISELQEESVFISTESLVDRRESWYLAVPEMPKEGSVVDALKIWKSEDVRQRLLDSLVQEEYNRRIEKDRREYENRIYEDSRSDVESRFKNLV